MQRTSNQVTRTEGLTSDYPLHEAQSATHTANSSVEQRSPVATSTTGRPDEVQSTPGCSHQNLSGQVESQA